MPVHSLHAVDCAAYQLQLLPAQPTFPFGSTSVNAMFLFTAPVITGTPTFLATLDGLHKCQVATGLYAAYQYANNDTES
jgi:hypothetical protein